MSAEDVKNGKSYDITEVTRRMLRPYTIRAGTPYLSEDQRRLSELTLPERSAWMAEWLRWASETPNRSPNDWGD